MQYWHYLCNATLNKILFSYTHLKDKDMFYLPYFLLYSRFDWTRRYFLRRRQKLTTLCPQQQHVILLTKDQLTFFWLRWANSELVVGVVLWTRKAVCKWITAWFICTWRQWYLWQYPDVKYKGGFTKIGISLSVGISLC